MANRCLYHPGNTSFPDGGCPECIAGNRRSNPCATCTIYCDTVECTNCWEVEHRLSQYLKSIKGRAKIATALASALVLEAKK